MSEFLHKTNFFEQTSSIIGRRMAKSLLKYRVQKIESFKLIKNWNEKSKPTFDGFVKVIVHQVYVSCGFHEPERITFVQQMFPLAACFFPFLFMVYN